jgi:methionyl-tRNA synthetase
MDAPIGYIAAFEEYSRRIIIDMVYGSNEKIGEIYHFIGKDICLLSCTFLAINIKRSRL